MNKNQLFLIVAIVILLTSFIFVVIFAINSTNNSKFINYNDLPSGTNLKSTSLHTSKFKLVGTEAIINNDNIINLIDIFISSHPQALEKLEKSSNSLNFVIYPGEKKEILTTPSSKIIKSENNLIISGNNIYLIENDLDVLNDYEQFNREVWRSFMYSYFQLNQECKTSELNIYSDLTSQSCGEWLTPYPNKADSYTTLELDDCKNSETKLISNLFICEGSLAQTQEISVLPPVSRDYWAENWNFSNNTNREKLKIISSFDQIKVGFPIEFKATEDSFSNWEYETFSNQEFTSINSTPYIYYPVMDEPLNQLSEFLLNNGWQEVIGSEEIKDNQTGIIQSQKNYRKNQGFYQYELSLRILDSSELLGDCIILNDNGIPGQTFCNDGSIIKNSGNLIEINLANRNLYSVQS